MAVLLALCVSLLGRQCTIDDLAAHKPELGIDHLTECFVIAPRDTNKVCETGAQQRCSTVALYAGMHPYDTWVCLFPRRGEALVS